FNTPPTTRINTLSLHDALPIWVKVPTQFCQYVRWSPCGGAHRRPFPAEMCCPLAALCVLRAIAASPWFRWRRPSPPCPRYYGARSEEHTSELQSLRHLVCRLLL